MDINWTVRFKNRTFWMTLLPMLAMFAQLVGDCFGIHLDLGPQTDKLLAVIDVTFGILAVLGIVNDPTTKGINDSAKAMGYTEPKERPYVSEVAR
jgi:phi LC3 family holin